MIDNLLYAFQKHRWILFGIAKILFFFDIEAFSEKMKSVSAKLSLFVVDVLTVVSRIICQAVTAPLTCRLKPSSISGCTSRVISSGVNNSSPWAGVGRSIV